MLGHHFNKFDPNEQGKSKFQQLLDVFMQLLTYTSGDVSEAMQWLNQLDREYEMTDDEYGIGDFIDELKEKRISHRRASDRSNKDHSKNRTGHPQKKP